ncbi:Uncharacterised protein [uncultured archaeon]|nr:Uncharacterised protein [uncultured archaeon]
MDLSADIGITQGDVSQGCTKLSNDIKIAGDNSIQPNDPLTDSSGNKYYGTVETLGNTSSESTTWQITLQKEASVVGSNIGGNINICAKDASQIN